MTKEKTEGLSELLERGQKAAQRLAPATDKLTETIAQIERALTEQRFGSSASIELSSDTEYDDDTGYPIYMEFAALAFRKEGKTWRLMIDSGIAGEPDTWTSSPLINASRELRMLAVDRLPGLVAALVDDAEKRITEVEAKQATADALLATLKRRAGGTP
jgi:hypothetical protein